MVAVWLDVTVPSVAVNVTDVEPAGTVTDPGTVSRLLELDSVTAVDPVGTATLNATVQVDEVPDVSVVGVQVTDDSSGFANTGTAT
jgi:hypothetical protein